MLYGLLPGDVKFPACPSSPPQVRGGAQGEPEKVVRWKPTLVSARSGSRVGGYTAADSVTEAKR